MFRVALVLTSVSLLLAACGGDDEGGGGGSGGGGETQAAFDAAKLEELAATPVEGYTPGEPLISETGNAIVTYTPDDEAVNMRATVTLSPCDAFLCYDLDGEITEEREQSLRSILPQVHADNPDLVFEYGTAELAPGYESFFVYDRSFVDQPDGSASANGYQALYHDETNYIAINVTQRPELGPESEADLFELEAGRAEAEKFFAAFQDQFGAAD